MKWPSTNTEGFKPWVKKYPPVGRICAVLYIVPHIFMRSVLAMLKGIFDESCYIVEETAELFKLAFYKWEE